jgi:hypothetical protein
MISEKYSVMSIDKTQYSEWLKYKHYAKRIPQVSFAFGLFNSLPDNIIVGKELGGKHRYFMFIGTKSEIKNMKKHFKYTIEPYPKGNNTRYDASFVPEIQEILF